AEEQVTVTAVLDQEEEIPDAPVREEQPSAEDVGNEPMAEKIEAFLTGLLAHMEVSARPVITRTEEGSYKVELVGSGLGAVIGRRGETLDAIQQLTSYAVNRGLTKRVR